MMSFDWLPSLQLGELELGALQLGWALLVLVLGFFLARVLPGRLRFGRLPESRVFVYRQLARYVLVLATLGATLRVLGIDPQVLLGAAGVMTVAIGFASQTSISHLVSGLFLMGEQPFRVGDLIEVDGVMGEVLSIDLMSVKLRTFDNQMVRVPNEAMLKSTVSNLTRFPIRRIDIELPIAFDTPIAEVREVAFSVAEREARCLDEPTPVLHFAELGEYCYRFKFTVWTTTDNIWILTNDLVEQLQAALLKAEIDLPVPPRELRQPKAPRLDP